MVLPGHVDGDEDIEDIDVDDAEVVEDMVDIGVVEDPDPDFENAERDTEVFEGVEGTEVADVADVADDADDDVSMESPASPESSNRAPKKPQRVSKRVSTRVSKFVYHQQLTFDRQSRKCLKHHFQRFFLPQR